MKKNLIVLIGLFFGCLGYSQTDTISENIYQKDGNLGIGISDPETLLRIEGNVSEGDNRAFLRMRNTNAGDKASVSFSLESNDKSTGTSFTHTSNSFLSIDDFNDMGTISTNGKGFSIYSTSDSGSIRFYTNLDQNGIIERMRINSEGYIGIGTDDPKVKLDIAGGLRIGDTDQEYPGTIKWTGSDFLGYNGTDWLSLFTVSQWAQNNNGLYFASGNVGIGSASNDHTLEIQSDIGSGIERNLLKINNLSNGNSSYTGIILKTGENDLQSVIQDYGLNYTASPHYDFGGFLNISNNSRGIMLHANSRDGIIKFYTGHDETAGAGIERLRIDSTGNIGIGTKEPAAKLQITDGDIYISDIDKGIIMKSPDGNCWRGVLDNLGQLSFTLIDCPEVEAGNDVQTFANPQDISIYPNPSNSEITIKSSYNEVQMSTYRIYDISGHLQSEGKIQSEYETISISDLLSGIYVISIFNNREDKLLSHRIVKE